MKKGIVVALVGVFSVFAVSTVVMAAEGADGKMTLDKPEAVWGKARTKSAVTFNHKKHGAEQGCVKCHHTQPTLGKDPAVKAKSCFECHGAEAKDKQLSAKDMIHKGTCIPCHKTDAKAMEAKAPTACAECHPAAK